MCHKEKRLENSVIGSCFCTYVSVICENSGFGLREVFRGVLSASNGLRDYVMSSILSKLTASTTNVETQLSPSEKRTDMSLILGLRIHKKFLLIK